MYGAAPFHQRQPDEQAHELLRSHPLATLVVTAPGGAGIPEVHHVPLLLNGDHCKLIGHIARNNPLVRLIGSETLPCVAVFHGPEAYVSPSWYASKAEDGRVVPTWNYTKVHVEGAIRVISDRAWILDAVTQLTNHMEPTVASDWQVGDAPEAYIDAMLKAITGIEISICALTGKFKLSQNKSPANVQGILSGLRARSAGPPNVVAWMERVNPGTDA